ncbi:MAG: hypothetical protein E7478_08440 [Ruminococcaceae bacterium]|nr:hypothetical protein [Oscillospiraceae bacterium]
MRYEYISTLKASEKGDIRLVRGENGTLLIQRYRDIDRQLLKKLMEIECPYIVKKLDFSEDENGFFTIEEYIEGTPANDTQFTEKLAVQALIELCEALKTLHKNGIVHRDIKPSNIIVGKDGYIRLIDFDTARLMKEYQSHDTGYLGTIGYAPPEQYGFMQTDARSDVYAFGMTMEELLGKAAAKPKFRRIIAKCTAFDPEKRYSDISLVERELERRFSPATVIAICGAALIMTGVLLLSQGKEPQAQTPADLITSETAVIPTTEITSELIVSSEETAESTDSIDTSEQADEIPTSETSKDTQSETVEQTTEQSTPTEGAVVQETTEATQETSEADDNIATSDMLNPNRMTFETLQDENGRNYDSYEYVFYDDPELHGSWVLCSFSRAIPEGEIRFPGTLAGYQPNYITVLPDGTLNTYNAGLRELNSFRWTNGYCIDDSTDIHKVERLFVLTNSDGTQYLIYERKPMYNGDDAIPHLYFIYKRVG